MGKKTTSELAYNLASYSLEALSNNFLMSPLTPFRSPFRNASNGYNSMEWSLETYHQNKDTKSCSMISSLLYSIYLHLGLNVNDMFWGEVIFSYSIFTECDINFTWIEFPFKGINTWNVLKFLIDCLKYTHHFI